MSRIKLSWTINQILRSRFFTTSCNFTRVQLKAGDDRKCILQGMMLLDTNYVAGFELKDFSENSIIEYFESIRGNYSDRQIVTLKSTVEYLTDAFPQCDKQLKKINIPILMYLADVAMDAGVIKPVFFRQWWEVFTGEDPLFEEYKRFCGTGYTELEKSTGGWQSWQRVFVSTMGLRFPKNLRIWWQRQKKRRPYKFAFIAQNIG